MIVARVGDTLAGFLQLLRADEGLVIDLIGVDEERRGSGIARSMISFAAERCAPYEYMDVGTQLMNLPSLRLYLGLGFRPYAAQHVFHLHRS